MLAASVWLGFAAGPYYDVIVLRGRGDGRWGVVAPGGRMANLMGELPSRRFRAIGDPVQGASHMISVNAFLDEKGRQVYTMSAKDTVIEAAQVMTKRVIGCVVVVKSDEVMGIFTERDMVRNVVLEKRAPGGYAAG